MVIGFDVSKQEARYALVNKAGKVRHEGSCENSTIALQAVLEPLKERHTNITACVESTGTCHLAVLRAANTCSVPCRLINPIQTNQFVRMTIRGSKTDRQDAIAIALLGLRDAGYIVQAMDQPMAQARAYARLAHRLRGVQSKLEQLRQHMVSTGLALDTTGLVACQESMGETVLYYRALADVLLASDERVSLLRSIPGIGPVCALGIVSELSGSVERFAHAEQLVAYAGLDPRIKQSGMSSSNGRLTKRGSPYLRYWLFIAANVARQYDPELHDAYERRRNAGKSHTVATVAIARKLTHRVYAVLKRGTPYDVRQATTDDHVVSA